MNIHFNPRVSGSFVEHVIRQKSIYTLLEAAEVADDMRHGLVKEICIICLRDFEVDVNKVINSVKAEG